jgi:APA family basic amino acid/polyamine antiporter
VTTVKRILGPFGAAGLGLSAMLGAGVFWVWGPVVERAGSLFLVAIALAGAIAMLNALTVSQLAFLTPVSGGVYAYAKAHVSPGTGFMAGWFFLVGKTASAAAIAAIAAAYVSPTHAGWMAPLFIGVFALINITGIRSTAAVGITIAGIVTVVLLAVILGSPPAPSVMGFSAEVSAYSLWQASGLMFFAFAGYARMATLGAEVKNPTVVLPRVIIGTLLAVIILYSLVALSVVRSLGYAGVASSATPVADASPEEWRPLVAAIAVLASLGALSAILAGLSRTSLAMATQGDLPRGLSHVWSRTSSPAAAEITMAILAMVVAATVDPLYLVGISATTVLTYYALAHVSALRLAPAERRIPRAIAWVGLLGCASLVLALPLPSVLAGAGVAVVGLAVWWVLRKPQYRHG